MTNKDKMSNIVSALLDISVVALPDDNSGKEDILMYIEKLIGWKKLADESWIELFIGKDFWEGLSENNLYPYTESVKKLFLNKHIYRYDANTVTMYINTFLSKLSSFEESFHIQDVVYDLIEINPEIKKLTLYDCSQLYLKQWLVILSILSQYCNNISDYVLILQKTSELSVNIKAQIYALKHERDDISNLQVSPESFEGCVKVRDNIYDLIDLIDEGFVLIQANDDEGVKLAIKIRLFKSVEKQDDIIKDMEQWKDLPLPIIGSSFRKTCQKICKDNAKAIPNEILRSIVDAVNETNLNKVHALRTGLGGDDPKRTRGADKAYRQDIDREFHLHYWKRDDGRIELASVVYHNDFSIPE